MKKPVFLLLIMVCMARMAQAQNNFLDFDGSNDYVKLDNSITYGPEFTIEAWINVDNLSGYYEIFSYCDDPNSACSGVDYEVVIIRTTPGGKIEAAWSPSSFSARRLWATTINSISAGQWHHVAMTVNSTSNTIAVYINGVAQALSLNNLGTGSGVAIGKSAVGSLYITNLSNNANSTSYHFNGRIDEIRVWNTALLQAQLAANMNTELTGNESGLVSYYRFNQGACGGANASEFILNDNSSSGNNGTLQNFALSGCNSNWVCGGVTCGYTDNGLMPATPVPTLSEWGLIIFALLLLCTGAVAVWNRRYGMVILKV